VIVPDDKLNVGVFIFEQVEVLDFAGPFEVFSRTRLTPGLESRRSEESAPFNVFTVARTTDALHATGDLRVIPGYDFAAAPKIDLLVVPGGFGTRALLEDVETLEWIQKISDQAQLVTSVCTGSLLLAKVGLLANRKATTHWGALDLLSEMDDSIRVEGDQRVVDDGVVTSAGVSAGIDLAFSMVEKLFGREVADETARYIEYPRS
jgi:transcriptional regulator GlxA family with amidase domain